MKKYISVLLAVIFCFTLSVTAFAETVTIGPDDVSNPDIKTSVLTYGGGFGFWLWVIIAVVVVVGLFVIIIKKNKN